MPRVSTIVFVATAILAGAVGTALGALPLTAAEPDGQFVDCGPAVFGRPSPLPDPVCAGAYDPLPWLSIAFLVGAVVLAALAVRSVLASSRDARQAVTPNVNTAAHAG